MADPTVELLAMTAAYEALKDLDSDQCARALVWLAGALDVTLQAGAQSVHGAGAPAMPGRPSQIPGAPVHGHQGILSDTTIPTARDFVMSKRPANSAERIACLAYYLTHYRGQRAFKAPDLATLNTEAAQPKFGNASRDVDNADRTSGYLVSAGNNQKQLSPRGEAVVLALPDRDAVGLAQKNHPIKRRTKKSSPKKALAADHASIETAPAKQTAAKRSTAPRKGLPRP
ncbi:MAG TPA: hypothetical protein VMU51_26865 [Mycobacteriales bacterium]|nr:hypothetical protein [Mycobacteriales bacterium]